MSVIAQTVSSEQRKSREWNLAWKEIMSSKRSEPEERDSTSSSEEVSQETKKQKIESPPLKSISSRKDTVSLPSAKTLNSIVSELSKNNNNEEKTPITNTPINSNYKTPIIVNTDNNNNITPRITPLSLRAQESKSLPQTPSIAEHTLITKPPPGKVVINVMDAMKYMSFYLDRSYFFHNLELGCFQSLGDDKFLLKRKAPYLFNGNCLIALLKAMETKKNREVPEFHIDSIEKVIGLFDAAIILGFEKMVTYCKFKLYLLLSVENALSCLFQTRNFIQQPRMKELIEMCESYIAWSLKDCGMIGIIQKYPDVLKEGGGIPNGVFVKFLANTQITLKKGMKFPVSEQIEKMCQEVADFVNQSINTNVANMNNIVFTTSQ